MLLVGCSARPDGATGDSDVVSKPKATGPGASNPAPASEALAERPWEVLSNKGETFLANVFYADASQNEQVMPWTLDGRAGIDRLVYPTLGNPNLYVRDDAQDELVMVIRIEADALGHLSPRFAPALDTKPAVVTLNSDDANGVAFFLVAHSARDAAESASAQAPRAGVYRIDPKTILANAEPGDMPAALKKRHTLRFVFDQAAMKDVPPGLYDARFEVKKAGQIYANVYEWQSNAVRVFDHAADEYTALNVTDTQVSVGFGYDTLTAAKIDDFVDAVNTSGDAAVTNAAFITFNGDLHNGGAPGTLLERSVATTYRNEAKRVVSALKRLELPIFLTPGNHDGYVALGHVPEGVAAVDRLGGVNLQNIIDGQNDIAWPDYSWASYSDFLAKTPLDGRHLDIVTGGFKRAPGATFAAAFAEVPHADRNMILYDGFYQWQKTYGPLQQSWKFGKNRYVSLNTYEQRQHRRNGWGMYTVNYGGAVTPNQLAWVDRELARAQIADEDVVMLMHHDPRGGHKGKDFGYYFPVLSYTGVEQSLVNYLIGNTFTSAVCKLDDAQLSVDDRDSCIHDGLQEWMGPEEDFDRQGSAYFMSGVELLHRIVASPQVRTLLIGHAHLNSMEVLQQGDVLVPGKVSMDPGAAARLTWLEGSNPVRNLAWAGALALPGADVTAAALTSPIDRYRARLDVMLDAATPPTMRTLAADASGPRELAVLRLTSNADLTSEKFGTQSMFGWAVLHVNGQAGPTPRINRVTYFIHTGLDAFAQIETVDVDRTRSMAAKAPDNRVAQLFTW